MAKQINKEQIVTKTMELILEKGTSESLTIREIAKALNCSHPNIYNYYSGIGDLMWDVLSAILEEMVESVLHESKITIGDDRYDIFIKCYLRFCFEKMPWYRVMWFDRITGDIPERVKKTLLMPAIKFPEILMEMVPEIGSINQAAEIGRIINSYIRGEVGAYVTGRVQIVDIDMCIERARSDIIKITKALIRMNQI